MLSRNKRFNKILQLSIAVFGLVYQDGVTKESIDQIENSLPISEQASSAYGAHPSLNHIRAKLHPELAMMDDKEETKFFNSRGEIVYSFSKKVLGLDRIYEAVISPNGKGLYICGRITNKWKYEEYKILYLCDNHVKDITPPDAFIENLSVAQDETLYCVNGRGLITRTILCRKDGSWAAIPSSIQIVLNYYAASRDLVYLWGWEEYDHTRLKLKAEIYHDNGSEQILEEPHFIVKRSSEGTQLLKLFKGELMLVQEEDDFPRAKQATDFFFLKEKPDLSKNRTKYSFCSLEKTLYKKDLSSERWVPINLSFNPEQLIEFSDHNILVQGVKSEAGEEWWAFIAQDGDNKNVPIEYSLKGTNRTLFIGREIDLSNYLENVAPSIFLSTTLDSVYLFLVINNLSTWPNPKKPEALYQTLLKAASEWPLLSGPSDLPRLKLKTALSLLIKRYQQTWVYPYLKGLLYDLYFATPLVYMMPTWGETLQIDTLMKQALALNLTPEDDQWPPHRLSKTRTAFNLLKSLKQTSRDFFYKFRFNEPFKAIRGALRQLETSPDSQTAQ